MYSSFLVNNLFNFDAAHVHYLFPLPFSHFRCSHLQTSDAPILMIPFHLHSKFVPHQLMCAFIQLHFLQFLLLSGIVRIVSVSSCHTSILPCQVHVERIHGLHRQVLSGHHFAIAD